MRFLTNFFESARSELKNAVEEVGSFASQTLKKAPTTATTTTEGRIVELQGVQEGSSIVDGMPPLISEDHTELVSLPSGTDGQIAAEQAAEQAATDLVETQQTTGGKIKSKLTSYWQQVKDAPTTIQNKWTTLTKPKKIGTVAGITGGAAVLTGGASGLGVYEHKKHQKQALAKAQQQEQDVTAGTLQDVSTRVDAAEDELD